VIGQNGAIALNGGAPAVNGVQLINGNPVSGISGTQGTGIQMIQTDAVAVNGNVIDGNGIKPVTLIEQPTAATNIGFNGNQGGIDKNIVASQQYNIGSVISGNGGKPAGGLILNNTGNTGIQAKSAGVGTSGLIKNIKLK
jgi:hypothetical protein